MSRFFTLFLIITTCLFHLDAIAQSRYVVVERFGGKRLRLVEGDELHFKLKGQSALYNDVITGFRDSLIFISSGIRINTKDISSVYKLRKSWKAIRIGMQTVGAGFIIFPSLAYFTSRNKYSPKESIIIGSSMIALSQFLRFIPRWKKYKMDKNSRIWIYQ
jgi:hypothetical protein